MPDPKSSDSIRFSATLDTLHAADAEFEAAFPFAFGDFEPQGPVRSDHLPRHSLSHVPEMLCNPSYVAAENLTRLYSETDWADPVRTESGNTATPRNPVPAPDPIPLFYAPPPSDNPQVIADELGLHTCATAQELHRARRRFALVNHPDRVAPWLHELATRRMKIANMLIDQALAQAISAKR